MSDSISGFDSTIGALNTSLNLRLENQNVISSNVANADTPGYHAKALEFEQAFRQVLGVDGDLPMEQGHPDHLVVKDTDPVYPNIIEIANGEDSLDGNTVNRSEELSKMAQNKVLYEAGAELLKRKLAMLKYAISEGGGNR